MVSIMKNTEHLNEHYEIQERFIEIVEEKEKKQNKFLKYNLIKDYKNNEYHKMSFDLEKWYIQQGQLSLQKLLYNKSVSKDLGLGVSFITLTLPSRFHKYTTTEKVYDKKLNKYVSKPLKFEDWKLNKHYNFSTMEESIEEGYKYLSTVWRDLYLSIKLNKEHKDKLKNMKYDVVSEFTKQFSNHLHILLYHDKKLSDFIYEEFENIIKKYEDNKNKKNGMNRDSNDIKQDFKKIDFGVNYIMKYITKTLFVNQKNIVVNGVEIEQDKEDLVEEQDRRSYIEMYNGWRTILGKHSRIHKSSNSKLGIGNYKRIYHSMSEVDKEILLKRSKDNNTCLLYEIEKVTYKETLIQDEKETKFKKFNEEKRLFNECMFSVYVEKEVIRTRKLTMEDIKQNKYIHRETLLRTTHKKHTELVENIKDYIEELKKLSSYLDCMYDTEEDIISEELKLKELINTKNKNKLHGYKVNSLIVLNKEKEEIYNKDWYEMTINQDIK